MKHRVRKAKAVMDLILLKRDPSIQGTGRLLRHFRLAEPHRGPVDLCQERVHETYHIVDQLPPYKDPQRIKSFDVTGSTEVHRYH